MEGVFKGMKVEIPQRYIRSKLLDNREQAVIVINHRWLEQFAEENGIAVDYQPILASEKHFVFKAVLTYPGGQAQAIGEANEVSCKDDISRAYMGTMAAHRAFDRAMLKLLRLHHVYGSTEEFVDCNGAAEPADAEAAPAAANGVANGANGTKPAQNSGKSNGQKSASNKNTNGNGNMKADIVQTPNLDLIVNVGIHRDEKLTLREFAKKYPDELKRIAAKYKVQENSYKELIMNIHAYARQQGWPVPE